MEPEDHGIPNNSIDWVLAAAAVKTGRTKIVVNVNTIIEREVTIKEIEDNRRTHNDENNADQSRH